MAFGEKAMTGGRAKKSSKELVRPKPQPKAPPKPKNPAAVAGGIEAGGLKLGHQLWKLGKPGRKRLYETPEALWEDAREYFDWTEDNPLREQKLAQDGGAPVKVSLDRMRAMSLKGLCIFLDITENCWKTWKDERPDLADIQWKIEALIFTWKFEGAAAGMLNAGIISRELGLAEKRENTGQVQVIISGEDAEL